MLLFAGELEVDLILVMKYLLIDTLGINIIMLEMMTVLLQKVTLIVSEMLATKLLVLELEVKVL